MKNIAGFLLTAFFLLTAVSGPVFAETKLNPDTDSDTASASASDPSDPTDPAFEVEESTSADSTVDIGQRIVEQAFTYKGTRYRFGGHSRKGIDCTGLIIKVWDDLDLGKLKGNCSALYKLGRAVGPEEARPGDLVFFKNTYRRGVSHVGIYIGNYEFIHASRGRGVNVSKLTSPYYLNRIVGGRRLYE